jgi:metallo-beta-lactamase class B
VFDGARLSVIFVLPVLALIAASAFAQGDWTLRQAPFQIFGNTYYVGTRGLSVILITSDEGHVLIDAGLPESPGAVASNIRALGFKVEDVRLIVGSHVHFDHAGGMSELQRMSRASAAATRWSASVLTSGAVPRNDPQFGVVAPVAAVRNVTIVTDGETLRVGPLAMTAHETPGHTPGGTSWTWRSCHADDCADFVYADSLTAVSADGFLFTRSRDYPHALADFERSFRTLETVACGILLTPHPEASGLWARLERRDTEGDADAMKDPAACHRYVSAARERLAKRIALESLIPNPSR